MRSIQLVGRRFTIMTCAVLAAAPASGQVELIESFNTGLGSNLVGLGYDPVAGELAVYRNYDRVVRLFDPVSASETAQVNRAGNAANDFDLDVLSAPAVINGTWVPADTLLMLNGDDTPNRVYAVDPTTGLVLAEQPIQGWNGGPPRTLVGGSYHAGRGTLYVVDYRQDMVAEIDLNDGTVLQEFNTGINVYYGDVEVSQTTGNLLVVTDRRAKIREITPDGQILGDIDVSAFVGTNGSGIAGIAADDASGLVWLGLRYGEVVCLSGVIEEPEFDTPVCTLEPLQPVACQGASTNVQLFGGAENTEDEVTFAWTTTCANATFDDPESPAPILSLDSSTGCPGLVECSVELIVTGPGGASAPCVQAVTVIDEVPPEISLETTEIIVKDTACHGAVKVDLPAARVEDDCDDEPVLTVDGPEMFEAGVTTRVVYTAQDQCNNTAEAPMEVRVEHGANLMIRVRAVHYGPGQRGTKTVPVVGAEVMAFDLSSGTCAQRMLNRGHKDFDSFLQSVTDACGATAGTAATDARGVGMIDVPPGHYLAIARTYDNAGRQLMRGARVGRLRCGQTKRKVLLMPMHFDGPAPRGGGPRH